MMPQPVALPDHRHATAADRRLRGNGISASPASVLSPSVAWKPASCGGWLLMSQPTCTASFAQRCAGRCTSGRPACRPACASGRAFKAAAPSSPPPNPGRSNLALLASAHTLSQRPLRRRGPSLWHPSLPAGLQQLKSGEPGPAGRWRKPEQARPALTTLQLPTAAADRRCRLPFPVVLRCPDRPGHGGCRHSQPGAAHAQWTGGAASPGSL